MLPAALDTLSDFLDIRGAGSDAGALRNAAAAIRQLQPAEAAAFVRRARAGQMDGVPLIGPAAEPHLRSILAGDAAAAIDAARAGIPQLLGRLLDLGIVSTREAASLVRQQGVATLSDLQAALADGRVTQFGVPDFERRLRAGAVALAQELRPVPLGRATDLLEEVAAAVARCCSAVDLVTPAGGVRRFESLVDGLVLVGRAPDPSAAVETLTRAAALDDVLHRTGRRAILLVQQTEVDIRIAAPDDYGTVLFTATGSPAHLRGVHARRGRPPLAASEDAVYAHAGLPFIPPELREGDGEIEAAAAGRLPALVRREDIRGDLHMHTTSSDGADTLAAMVAECAALGYEYIAITDHSERAAAGRTLTRSALTRQREEIEALRERYPLMRILHGIEVDIMPDGRLDFEDAVLEPLDLVLASLHDPAHQDPRTLTRRCLKAIRHPLVNVITHPANRLVGRRPGYALDFDAVFAVAAETGTALEVDGAPSHLDLDGSLARRAIAAGATLTVDSDCHRARALQRQMTLGIGTARRGWVTPRHVLNARPVADVLAFVAAKRRH